MSLATHGECMSLPLVRLSEIPLEGIEVSCQAEASDLNLESADATIEGTLDVHTGILPVESDYHVQGELSGVILRNCVRCLDEYPDAVVYPFSVAYREKGRDGGNQSKKTKSGEPVVEKEDVDLSEPDGFVFEGEVLDLAPMLRELIILGNPIQALCRRDCRGLCPTCGSNKNSSPCACLEERLPNPFAVLQQFRNGQQGASQQSIGSSKPTRHEPTND